jgi:hypothetical protein
VNWNANPATSGWGEPCPGNFFVVDPATGAQICLNGRGQGGGGGVGLTSGAAVTTSSMTSSVVAGVAIAVVVVVAAATVVVKRRIASRAAPAADPVDMVVVNNPVYDEEIKM